MFLEGSGYLSILEIAHRWAGIDPDSTDENNLPDEVQYYIHKIIEGFLGEELKLRRANGYRAVRDPIYLLIWNVNPYFNFLWSCLNNGNFNKKKLSGFYVRRREIMNLCTLEEIEPPSFWTKQREPVSVIKANVTNRPKEEETDRLLCQAIAATLWELDPNIHPTHIAKSKVIQRFGQGRSYKELSTIKKWIADVDPLKNQRKSGRPPDISYKINLEMDSLLED